MEGGRKGDQKQLFGVENLISLKTFSWGKPEALSTLKATKLVKRASTARRGRVWRGQNGQNRLFYDKDKEKPKIILDLRAFTPP